MTAEFDIRKKEIMLKAMEIFAEKGIDGTSMRDLAEYLGTTKSYFYFYFSSKDDLIFNIHRYIMETAIRFVEGLSRGNLSPKRKVESWIRWHFEYIRRRHVFVNFMYHAMFSKYSFKAHKMYKGEFERLHKRYVKAISEMVKQGQEAGTFKNSANPLLVSSLIVGSLFSGVKLAYRGIFPVDEVENAVKESILAMLKYEKV